MLQAAFEALPPTENFGAQPPVRSIAGAFGVCVPVKPSTSIVSPLESVTDGLKVTVIVLSAPCTFELSEIVFVVHELPPPPPPPPPPLAH